MNDEAALYLAAAVIEQGVRDWRAARNSHLIDENGNMIRENFRSKNGKMPATFDDPAEVDSLRTFFFCDGLELFLVHTGLKVNPDFIVNGLERSVKNKRQYLHWQRQEPPRPKESF